MKLTITFLENGKEVALALGQGERLIIPIDFHFDTHLIDAVDKILKKNRIDILTFREVSVEPGPASSSAAHRIAQAVREAIISQ